MSTTVTSVEVVCRKTGEILDIKNADTERLALFHTDVDDLKRELADAQGEVNRELVARLDRNACWTERVGDPTQGVQWEIKAPSPTAGTETYPARELETELRALVERGTISEQGASKALTRKVLIEVEVPLSADLDQMVDALHASDHTELAGVTVTIVKAEPVRKAVMAGINALRKVPGTSAALDRARVVLPVGSRRATVKRKEQER